MSQTLSAEIAAQLEGLRDIYLPPAVSWWPLAYGWWVVIALIPLLIITVVLIRRQRQRSLKLVTLGEFNQLKARFTADAQRSESQLQLAAELSVLLHRLVLGLEDQNKQSISGDNWIHYLSNGKNGMDQKVAQFLAVAPYRHSLPADAPAAQTTTDAVELWIRKHA
ncbi:DUF4381 domain-containing protein [Vibrio sp. SCSIO 43137]|uniref:DUF4381 domain-containing protein n=1 Tax=Vibrio sp. SCSIO 43137 TaxID=3021011 RepID=UPI00230758A3|nr:DUF4381 domain-containing protein [Vibrio sp. SCSIO 43137]WCE28903.1 DUF4381 domain-containing protein [Vibrio sp. SCSIO 43137]